MYPISHAMEINEIITTFQESNIISHVISYTGNFIHHDFMQAELMKCSKQKPIPHEIWSNMDVFVIVLITVRPWIYHWSEQAEPQLQNGSKKYVTFSRYPQNVIYKNIGEQLTFQYNSLDSHMRWTSW